LHHTAGNSRLILEKPKMFYNNKKNIYKFEKYEFKG